MHRDILLVLCCLGLSMPCSALDLRPYAGPDAPLAAARAQHSLPVWRTLTIASYDARGLHGAWDTDLRQLLEQACLEQSGTPATLSADERRQLAMRVEAGACSDPIASWAAFALTSERDARWRSAWQALRRLDADLAANGQAHRHPRVLEAMIVGHLLSGMGRDLTDDRRVQAVTLAKRLGESLAASIRAGECNDWPAILIYQVRQLNLQHQDYGEPVLQAIDAAVADAKPPQWFGLATRGTLRIANAWAWRGSGWANTVTAEGWRGFERNLAEADAMLGAAWQANPADPLVPAYACTLAGAGNSATPMEVWLQRAATACFDHPTAFDTALNFAKPRWGGSYDQMLALGCDGTDTDRFDTIVPWRVIAAVQSAVTDARQMKSEDALRQALGQPRVLAAVERCLTGYQRVHPDLTNRYACIRAAIHVHAGREQLARAALARLTEADVDANVARDFAVDLRALLRRAETVETF